MAKKVKDPNKKTLRQEFVEFAVKGNAMALAVGTIIGAAFGTITKSLTNDVIMPIVNIFLGGANFEEWKIKLGYAPWVEAPTETVIDEAGNEVVQVVENYLTWGNLLSAVINFLILAIVVFIIVKVVNYLSDLSKRKEREAAEAAAAAAAAEPPAPPAPSAEEVLLTEIRDLLKEK